MRADPASQRRLLELQAVDTAIAQLERKVQTWPIHQTIEGLAARRQSGQDESVAARTALSDAEAVRAKAEADVAPVRERLRRDQKRIHDGTLDAKALTAMIDEVAHLTTRVAVMEDEELEAMEALERAEARLARAQGALTAVEADLREALAQRDQSLDEARQEMRRHRAQRQALAGRLPDDLVGLYDKLRERYGGLGAAELKGRRCTGCGLEATTADHNRYLAAPPDEVLRCAECQRILVRTG
ncbi:MAG: nucleic acid-binding protein [Propionibacteriaceae bacterium]|nr:nucleic acid-binding protein [Propionibacteriaceae bacterium]